MSRKKKMLRFAELETFENVFQCVDSNSTTVKTFDGSSKEIKGHWSEQVFHNDHPLIIELACGKGEYTVSLAQTHPAHNFIGIDVKGNRMHRGAKKALSLEIANAAFLRIRIEWLTNHFASAELSEIWITFPYPFLKQSKANRGLTSPMFLDRYRSLLKPGGVVHLKTDSTELFAYSLQTLSEYAGAHILIQSDDIDRDGLTKEDLAIQTHYEGIHRGIGKPIKYVKWRFE